MVYNFGNAGFRRMLKKKLDDVSLIHARVKYDIYCKKNEQALPILHEIWTHNPPFKEPLRPGKDVSMKDYELNLPTDEYIKKYMKRAEQKQRENKTSPAHVDPEEIRLSKILGVTKKSGLDDKSVVMANAYEFAIRQLDVVTKNPNMSEEESVSAVEEMLKQEERKERHESRSKRREIETAVSDVTTTTTTTMETTDDENDTVFDRTTEHLKGLPTIFSNAPRKVSQMTAFGNMLAAMPYEKWSIGMATALDHWIATDILSISEDTWKKMLIGDETVGVSRTRDVIAVRGALFPETLAAQKTLEAMDAAGVVGEEEEGKREAEERIDELLAGLSRERGGGEDDDLWNFDDEDDDDDDFISDEEKREAKNDEYLEELQVWREKRQTEGNYEFWADEDKKKFDDWLINYMSFLAPNQSQKNLEIDYKSTRESFLSSPPTSRAQNADLWKKISDETDAEIFLDKLLANKPKDDVGVTTTSEYDAFVTLSYEEQVRRLVTIGTLRPLYDEYASDKDFDKFWEDYGKVLMDGVSLEYLVEDNEEGTLTSKDVVDFFPSEVDVVNSQKKYKLETKKYGEEEMSKEREAAALQSFAQYKAMRAEYEEKLFKEKVDDDEEYDEDNEDKIDPTIKVLRAHRYNMKKRQKDESKTNDGEKE